LDLLKFNQKAGTENLLQKLNFRRNNKMFNMINAVLQNKKGQGMVEYGLILALVAVVGMAGLVLLGPQVLAQFNTVAGAL
jgi:pilus assembly protein Flp/PilA